MFPLTAMFFQQISKTFEGSQQGEATSAEAFNMNAFEALQRFLNSATIENGEQFGLDSLETNCVCQLSPYPTMENGVKRYKLYTMTQENLDKYSDDLSERIKNGDVSIPKFNEYFRDTDTYVYEYNSANPNVREDLLAKYSSDLKQFGIDAKDLDDELSRLSPSERNEFYKWMYLNDSSRQNNNEYHLGWDVQERFNLTEPQNLHNDEAGRKNLSNFIQGVIADAKTKEEPKNVVEDEVNGVKVTHFGLDRDQHHRFLDKDTQYDPNILRGASYKNPAMHPWIKNATMTGLNASFNLLLNKTAGPLGTGVGRSFYEQGLKFVAGQIAEALDEKYNKGKSAQKALADALDLLKPNEQQKLGQNFTATPKAQTR